MQLYDGWRRAKTTAEREQAWLAMLAIHAEQVYTIGIVSHTLQPVVVSDRLRNVPADGVYSWDPGAYFGMYHPDTVWLDAGSAGSTSVSSAAPAAPPPKRP